MDKHDIFQMGYVSILMALISIIAHDWLLAQGVDQVTASTMMVNIIVISKIFYLFNIRTSKFALSKEFFSNKPAFLIIGVMILLQVILTYVPFMQHVFHTASMSVVEWGITLLAGLMILVITEIDKWIRMKRQETQIEELYN
jgi:Ca2+-transporting ATPase